MTLFFAIWWVSLEEAPTQITAGYFKPLLTEDILDFTKQIFTENSTGLLFPLIFFWYILGHITQWFSRNTKFTESNGISNFSRVSAALAFRPARPAAFYSEELKPLLDHLSKTLSPNEAPLDWKAFFPIAKNFVARNSASSLITNYQNKYTLHRSITITSAGLFWANSISIILTIPFPFLNTNLPLQIILVPSSLFLVWGFSGGYETNWKLFGNTVITEAYSLTHNRLTKDKAE